MATITASLTLSSPDLTSDALNLNTSTTLTKAGTSTGLSQSTGIARKTTEATATVTLFDGADYDNDKAHKIYIKNTSSTATEFITLFVNSEKIGRLYAGDWAFLPYSAEPDTNDLKYVPSVSTALTIEYALFYE